MATSSLPSIARDLHPIDASQNKENTRLIWLNANIDDSSDSLQTQTLFLELNPAAQFYTDLTKCIGFIKSSSDEQILLIVSGAFADQLLSQVHNLRSLTAVFILCENCSSYSGLRDQYSKIVNIFTDQNSLLPSIQDQLDVVEKHVLALSLFDQKQKSTRDLSKESTSFLWHQLLIDALKKMPHDEQAKNDMLKQCSSYYTTSKRELKEIKDFSESYKPEDAISWYTKECFLYRLLNKATRTEDIELLYSFRFFIVDLCNQLELESKKLDGGIVLTLYRGQHIPKEEFEKIRKSSGTLISTNGFLSTSRNINVAVNFTRNSVHKNDMETCILEIHADPSLKSIVFADIEQYSKVKGEQEVLIGLNATFKIEWTGTHPTLHMSMVKLTATDEGTTHFKEYMQAQEYEMKDYSPLVYFGRILWRDLGRADQAKKYFDMLLKTLPQDHPDMSDVYNEIAPLWSEIGDLDLAMENYKKAYDIRRRTLQKNHPKISISLNNIGLTYVEKGKHDTALEYYWDSLAINMENIPEPNQDWALRLGNIGCAHLGKGEYYKALIFLNQAYDIYKRVRPAQHGDIAWCLGSIGQVYHGKGEIDRALEYYFQQLEMEEKCLPLEHHSISIHLDWIARTYIQKGERTKGLAFCQEKLASQKNSLGENHPRIASTLMTIGKILKERIYYEQALHILEEYTPQDELRTIECLETLSDFNFKEGKFKEGFDHWMQILNIRRRIHSPDNPKIASVLQRIGDIHYIYMKNYSEAYRCYSQSLAIYRVNYEQKHPHVMKVNKKIYKMQALIDGGEDNHTIMSENKKDYLSPSETDSDVSAPTELTSFMTKPHNNPPMDEPKINETSNMCVLI